ncbi:MAG: putative sensor domain DACNV-containing protein, partial [Acidobacteriota bacterium]
MEHAYPKELTEFILKQWHRPCSVPDWQQLTDLVKDTSLPEPSQLERLLSICYQASLLRDEERPVRFRLILLEPDKLAAEHGPPKGLHRLVFTEPRPCTEAELRRLSPSTDFYHSLIGVRIDPELGFLIWGVLHSGRRWVQTLYGGGKSFQPLPSSLVIHVTNPGRISVCKGSIAVAALNAGQIICQSTDVFDSQWLKESFATAREHIWSRHESAREQASRPWARLDQEFLRVMKKQVIMRVISRIRHSHHGGTIVCVPHERAAEFTHDNRYVDLKYKFMDEEPRKRFQSLLLYIVNALAE